MRRFESVPLMQAPEYVFCRFVVGKFIGSEVIPALLAAGVGIKLGKTFDAALYNAFPEMFDYLGMSALNPDTWNTITAGDNSFGSNVFNMILELDEYGNPQLYTDEMTFAYMCAYMASQDLFESNGTYDWNDDAPQGFNVIAPVYHNETPFVGTVNGNARTCYRVGTVGTTTANIAGVEFTDVHQDYKVASGIDPNSDLAWVLCSKTSFPQGAQYSFNPITMEFNGAGFTGYDNYTYDGKTVYYVTGRFSGNGLTSYGTNYQNFVGYDKIGKLAWILQYGDFTVEGVDGVKDQGDAKVFDPSGITDYSDVNAVLGMLQSQYPELWDNRVEVSPDGETVIRYIPIGFPTGGIGDQPTTEGGSQRKPTPDISGDGQNVTDELIKTLIDIIQNDKTNNGMENDTDTPTQPVNPNPTGTGSGDTPTVIIPTGSAKSLYAIYNPTQTEINNFGSWLWSSAFVDQLLKLFNDPMQSIIGLHKIFVSPTISGTDTIHVGYLDSGVSSKIVGAQYVTVSCGSVSLSEYFGNVFDYDPFTEVHLYLPFIGIEKLNVGDVMRSTIEVVYHVDVITGACLAEVNVTRDLSGGTLYTYSGNCAVQYPTSAGSYMGIVASIASIAGGVVGTIASGGALAPMAFGAVNGILNAHTSVQHSGGFSGNAGAMGIKKPYLIISRQQTALAPTFPMFNGYPANESVILSECSGFIRCNDAHLTNIPATSSELAEIESLLKDGVIL